MFEVEDLTDHEVLALHARPKVVGDYGLIKTGSALRGGRIAKHKRLPRLEEDAGSAAMFAGRDPFAR